MITSYLNVNAFAEATMLRKCFFSCSYSFSDPSESCRVMVRVDLIHPLAIFLATHVNCENNEGSYLGKGGLDFDGIY